MIYDISNVYTVLCSFYLSLFVCLQMPALEDMMVLGSPSRPLWAVVQSSPVLILPGIPGFKAVLMTATEFQHTSPIEVKPDTQYKDTGSLTVCVSVQYCVPSRPGFKQHLKKGQSILSRSHAETKVYFADQPCNYKNESQYNTLCKTEIHSWKANTFFVKNQLPELLQRHHIIQFWRVLEIIPQGEYIFS